MNIVAEPTRFSMPELNEGEIYAGIILGKGGEPDQHLILLPGQVGDVDHSDAQNFATQTSGELPTRREQSLLYANLKEEFEDRWYWSSELHASNESYAWFQHFRHGTQLDHRLDFKCRARAVRRISITN